MKRFIALGAALMLALTLTAQVRAAEEAKPEKAEAKVEAKAFTGTAGCAHCNYAEATGSKKCGLAFKSGDKVYLVKAAKEDEALAAALAHKAFKGDMKVTGKTVKGDDGKEWLLAEKVEKAEAPAAAEKKAEEKKAE